MTTRAELSDIARQHHHQRRRPPHRRHMEIMTDAFAVVDGRRFHRAAVPRPANDEVFRCTIDLMHRIQVIVLEVNRIHW